MKGWVKGMLIASAVCIGTGTAMCAGAWAMGGRFSQFRHRRIQETEGEARTQEEVYEQSGSTEITEDRAVAERGIETEKTEAEQSVFRTATYDGADIRKMEIWLTGGKAEVITEDTAESIRVVCDSEIYRCYQEIDGDTLEIEIEGIKKNKDRFLWENFDLESENVKTVQIIIPAGSYFEEAELEVCGGVMTADRLCADSLDMEVEGGVLKVLGGSAGELNGECQAGNLVYEGQVSREADAECEAGFVQYLLEGREEDFTYEIDSALGSILISGTEQGTVRDETVIRNSGAVKYSKLECMAGKIQVDFYQE